MKDEKYYLPSNGTEGDCFQEDQCSGCGYWKQFENFEGCPIYDGAKLFEIKTPYWKYKEGTVFGYCTMRVNKKGFLELKK